MKISKIYSGIQSAGLFIGTPMTMVELHGDNMDASKSLEAFEELSPNQLVSALLEIGNHHICFAGGEPLLQFREFAGMLTKLGNHKMGGKFIYTHIETNGTIVPSTNFPYVDYWSINPVIPQTKPEKVLRLMDFVDRDAWIKFKVSSSSDVQLASRFMRRFAADIVTVLQPAQDNHAIEQTLSWAHAYMLKREWRIIPRLH